MNVLKFSSSYRKLLYTICKQRYNCNKNSAFNLPERSSFSHTNQKNNSSLAPFYGGILAYFGLDNDNEEEEADNSNDPEVIMGKVYYEIENNNLNEAKKLLDRIVEIVDAELESGAISREQYHRKCGFIYSTYGNVMLMGHELEAAVGKLQQSIRSCVYCGMSLQHETVLELSLKLALVYEKLKRLEEAESGFTFIIEGAQKELENVDSKNDAERVQNLKALLGMSSSYYGKFLYNRGRYQDSLVHSRKSLEIAKSLYKANHTNVLSKMNDIGATYLMMKKYKEARIQFEEAIKIYSKQPNDQTLLTVSVIYANLAQTYISDTEMNDDDRVENCERMCTKSDELLQSGFKMLNKEQSAEARTHVTECFELLAGLKSSLRVD